MPGFRIAAVGAAILLFSGVTIVSAAAQSATGSANAPGKPLQLLKIFAQPSKAKVKPHAKVLAKSSTKHGVRIAAGKKSHAHIATAQRPHAQEHTASAPLPENSWPVANSAVPADVAFGPPATQPAPPPTAAPAEPAASQLVVGGQTVQVTSPDDVNEMDLAANNTAAQTVDAAPSPTASATPLHEIAEPAPKSDAKSDLVNAASAPQQNSDVGSTSWILQVLAALGGAVTAGSVAWFLIGSTPQRTYG